MNDWSPISTAPRDRDLHLGVMEEGEVHALIFPCRRAEGGWVHAGTGRWVQIDPTHWREWRTEPGSRTRDSPEGARR